jgi:hypothetical protein
MSFNIFPEKIVKTRETSNGYFSEVFDFSTWSNIGFIGIIFIFIGVAIFAPVFAGLILLYQTFTKKSGDIMLNIFSILCSAYILLDLKKEWIVSIIMRPFYDANERKEVVLINIALIASNTILFIIGDALYDLFGKSKIFYFLFTVALTFFIYLLTKNII